MRTERRGHDRPGLVDVVWRPLAAQAHCDVEAYDAPCEGVPPHLRPSLRNWVREVVSYRRALAVQRLLRWSLRLDGPSDFLRHLDDADGDTWLDALDCALHLLQEEVRCACAGTADEDLAALVEEATVAVATLSDMLDEAGSAWSVDVSGPWGLRRRAAPAHPTPPVAGVRGRGTPGIRPV